ncbi:MAG TPA: WHG domain-containing protein [Oligoflexus sp.]|uniref:TetR/AcrR family transcriptional regulator n=1 Tax=Oligoflexus sp. TaxID=1971216 RepID=UPI002D656654|nr:WHG domain-containing protein [Oligoflexus sp.]HYX34107.1 WHG domain-containing protein [Oligoflexus sp.]
MKPKLTTEKIVQKATDIINKNGISTFTMSAVAEALRVTSPHLYKHISGLEPLLDGVTHAAFGHLKQVTIDAAIGKSGIEALIAIARVYREFGRNFPGEFACAARHSNPKDAETAKLRADIIQIYATIFGGKPDDDALIHKIRVYRSLIFGFVTLEVQGAFGDSRSIDESFAMIENLLGHVVELPVQKS